MARLVNGSSHGHLKGDFKTVGEFDICKKFDHAMAVLNKCQEAIELPNQLRSIADCLGIVIPKIEEISAEKEINDE